MISHDLNVVKDDFRKFRKQSEDLAAVYAALFSDAVYAADLDRWGNKLERVRGCGTLLEFDQFRLPDGQVHSRLSGANFCRVMLCPMCQWRRARRLYSDMLRIWQYTFDGYREIEFDRNRHRLRPRLRALLLTLTVPNVPAADLRETVRRMSAAWNRINQSNGYSEWRAILGYYRCLEITYNEKSDTYHPHYHVLLLVDDDYFRAGYVQQSRWLDIWRKSYRDDSIVAVDVRALRGGTPRQLMKSLNETCKYTVKPSDFLRGDMPHRMDIVETLDKSLDGVRRASFGGWLRDARNALKCDDMETREYMLDASLPLPDGSAHVGSVWLHWSTGAGDYLV